jgi:hypothetical protein
LFFPKFSIFMPNPLATVRAKIIYCRWKSHIYYFSQILGRTLKFYTLKSFIYYWCDIVTSVFSLFFSCFYRVSIKSFTDYKNLLQENYVEYKHFFTINLSNFPTRLPHWGSHVRRFLHATFPKRWIGRDDLTP